MDEADAKVEAEAKKLAEKLMGTIEGILEHGEELMILVLAIKQAEMSASSRVREAGSVLRSVVGAMGERADPEIRSCYTGMETDRLVKVEQRLGHLVTLLGAEIAARKASA